MPLSQRSRVAGFLSAFHPRVLYIIKHGNNSKISSKLHYYSISRQAKSFHKALKKKDYHPRLHLGEHNCRMIIIFDILYPGYDSKNAHLRECNQLPVLAAFIDSKEVRYITVCDTRRQGMLSRRRDQCRNVGIIGPNNLVTSSPSELVPNTSEKH
ncbi:hypothetical protein BD289DRAFT_437613 [Coniella lustricola]|uniref:Uncharacterized protein n=1 Tax=Coniella lustricola TaxID=2025994 RepID=A0A2T3A3Q2_9PEZI|nr:hypothetical protein BD289DRAFT_437613 [Coniella lustricola]